MDNFFYRFAVNGLGGPTLPMDCDTGQELLQGILGPNSPKQYSLLQNVCASYGLVTMKDEDDLGEILRVHC